MIILVSKSNKAVVDLTTWYDLDALKNNDTYITENMQGKHIEEPYVSERFDIIDIPDNTPMLLDEHGNYKSFKPNYYLWVDNELVKNPRYIDEDTEALRKSKLKAINTACHQAIINGFDYGGEHFSYDIVDQININKNASEAQTGKSTLLHADNSEYRMFTPNEMIEIANEGNVHKNENLIRHSLLKKWIERESDVQTLNGITFSSDLPDDLEKEMSQLMS